ncbi:hypothetical protein BD414DRAFT_485852 [Trametes punicea]|nr:hypothetical protein BD414DRAFT_485852 [Trametes punicea]
MYVTRQLTMDGTKPRNECASATHPREYILINVVDTASSLFGILVKARPVHAARLHPSEVVLSCAFFAKAGGH